MEVNKVKLEKFMQINKLTNEEEAKKQLMQEEDLEKENTPAPGSIGINADEESMALLVNQGLLASVVIGTTKEYLIGENIKLDVKTASTRSYFKYNYDAQNKKLTVSGKNCIISIDKIKNPDLSDLEIFINGSQITFSTSSKLKSITNKGIDNVINGSEEADTIINNGIDTIINAGAGDDNILSNGIGTTIRGGKGEDTISASGIRTNIFGNTGIDNIFANGINVFVDSGSNETDKQNIDNLKETIDVIGINMGIDAGTGHNKIMGSGMDITAIGSNNRENTTNEISFQGINVGMAENTVNQTRDTFIPYVNHNPQTQTGIIVSGVVNGKRTITVYENGVPNIIEQTNCILTGNTITQFTQYLDYSENAMPHTFSNIVWKEDNPNNWAIQDMASYTKTYNSSDIMLGNPTKTIDYYSNGSLTKRIVYTYDKDKPTKLISQKITVGNSVEERTFTYNDNTLIGFTKTDDNVQYHYTNITWTDNNIMDRMDSYTKTSSNGNIEKFENNKLTRFSGTFIDTDDSNNTKTTSIYENGKLISQTIEETNKTIQIEYDDIERIKAYLITTPAETISRTNFIYPNITDNIPIGFEEVINNNVFIYNNVTWKSPLTNISDKYSEENMSAYIKENTNAHTAIQLQQGETNTIPYNGSTTRQTATNNKVTITTSNYVEGKLTHTVNEVTQNSITNRTITKYDANGQIDGDVIEQTNVSKSNGKAIAFTQDGAEYSSIQWAANHPNDWDIEYIYAGTKVEGDKTYKKVDGGNWTEEKSFTSGTEITTTDDGNGKLLTRTITITDDNGNITTLEQSNFVYDTEDNTLIKGFVEFDGTDTFRYSNITWKENKTNDWDVNNIQTSNIEKKINEIFLTWAGTFTGQNGVTTVYENGKLIKTTIITTKTENGITTVSEVEYNEDGNTTKTTVTTSDGTNILSKTISTYTYNDAGKVLESTFIAYNKNEEVIKNTTKTNTYTEGKLTKTVYTNTADMSIAASENENQIALYAALGYDVTSADIFETTIETEYDENERIKKETNTTKHNDETTVTVRNNYHYENEATLADSFTETVNGTNVYNYSNIHYDDEQRMITYTKYDQTNDITLQFANDYYSKDNKPYEGTVVTTDDTTHTTIIAYYEAGKLKSEFITTTDNDKTTTTLAKYKENGYQLDTKNIVEQTGNNITSTKRQFNFYYDDENSIIEFKETQDNITVTFCDIEWEDGEMTKFFKIDKDDNETLYLNGLPANEIFEGYLYKDGICDESEYYIIKENNVIILNLIENEFYNEDELGNITAISPNTNTTRIYDATGKKISETRENVSLRINNNEVYGTIELSFDTKNNITKTLVTITIEDTQYPPKEIDIDASYLSNNLLAELVTKNYVSLDENIKNDIQILKAKEQAIINGTYTKDTLKSLLIKKETNTNIVIGDLVEKENDSALYIKDSDDNLKKLNISFDTYLELFPLVKRYDIHQSNINDCQFVSGILNASVKNPRTFAKLLQMFSEDKDKNLTVTFAGIKQIIPATTGDNEDTVNYYPITFIRDEDNFLLLKDNDSESSIKSFIYSKKTDTNQNGAGLVYHMNAEDSTILRYILDEDDNNNLIIMDGNNRYVYSTQTGGYHLLNESGEQTTTVIFKPLTIKGFGDEQTNNTYFIGTKGNYYTFDNNSNTYTLCNQKPKINSIIDTSNNHYTANSDGTNYEFYNNDDFFEPVDAPIGSQILEQAFAVVLFANQINIPIDDIDDIDVDDAIQFINQGDLQSSIFNNIFGDSGILLDFEKNKILYGIYRDQGEFFVYLSDEQDLSSRTKAETIQKLKDDLDNENIIATAVFNNNINTQENNIYNLIGWHSYSIEKITKNADDNYDYVYITNPWNTGATIKIPFDFFVNNVKNISLIDVTKTSVTDNPNVWNRIKQS